MIPVITAFVIKTDRLLENMVVYYTEKLCLLNIALGAQSVFSSFRDDEEKKKSPSEGTDEKANGTHPKTISRIGSTTNPFLDIPHDPNAAVYKSGFLARKIHADMDGKKSKHNLLSLSISFFSS